MKYRDLIQETKGAISSNKGRSALTILGIVIGIGSVIAMVSIGQGAQGSITESIEAGGANRLTISAGAQRSIGSPVSSGQGTAQSLSMEDADAIAKLPHIEAVSPELSSRYQVSAQGNNTNASITGVETGYQTVNNLEIESGMFFSANQISSSSKLAVLGAGIAEELYGEGTNPIGQSIKINGSNLKIQGVLKSTGESMSSSDDTVLVPLTVLQRYLTGSNYLSSIGIKVTDQQYMTQAENDITAELLALHDITNEDEADFRVRNMADMVEMASSITGTLTMLLGSIAGISLIVGGIGIMNMMLTTVTERTREIGLRKAIGAKRRDISLQFLAEAVMITFLGGVIGIIAGWLASVVIGSVMNTNTEVTLPSVALAFGVSVGIGIIFGYYPARRAARLNPIEALRYE